ncbi:hypothetical protein C8Q80DRAFT_825114 [Daedaleopsis nitida]|nr:hypothetical protein C8Q80DRAFT_825114 [Daedaleopsis nitida]
MVNRPRKANGAGKGLVAPDGGDPLPPDWEIRYPRNGGTDAYYYNIKTQESTWTRPGLPASGRASPTKIMGGAQTSDHSVPEVQDDAWARRGRVQQFDGSRRNATSRQTSSPHNPDLSYADRHYRPGEGPAPANAGEWRTDRGATGSSYPAESYVRARSTSPQPVSDDRRRTRSTSPQWDRRARRDVSQSPPPDRWRESRRELSQDRQTGHADSAWSRSQEYPEPVLSGPRSPTDRRVRHKDDVEPPLRRRKDDVDSTTRRKDDVEPRIRRNDDIDITLRRKDDTEPPMRRKDNIEPRLRRKDDIESPLRRKDDIEPLPRIPPSRDTSSRHPRDEWQAPSTLFASSASRLSRRRSSRGGGQALSDCLVKPWELSCMASIHCPPADILLYIRGRFSWTFRPSFLRAS